MRIAKIKRLVSFGYMENISMECEVNGDESPEMAASYLEDKIWKHVHNLEEMRKIHDDAKHENYNRSDPGCDDMPF